ncbi:MAG: GatB/YqeY domain-containing protein [Flavobacteriia bacterium]|nr:GatB/YqeY domain-containing protein [Flavobacteriia bacterium]
MGILSTLNEELKKAMLAKDAVKLDSLRAIKSAVLIAQTSGQKSGELSDEDSIQLLQRLVKQRRDSALLYRDQNRSDLAGPEEAQAEIIASFLPAQLSDDELKNQIQAIINATGATGMKEMGKVMGMVSKQLAGKAEGKRIADMVKQLLN